MNNYPLNINTFIEKSKKINGDIYDYSLVNYKNTNTKVKIVCQKHGIFEQIPKSHLKGSGCPKCNGGIKLDNKSFIEKAKLIHGERYDYSNIHYINSQIKIKIECKIHGFFYQTPASHLRNHGCPFCYGNVKSNNIDFIEKCKNVHHDNYDYSLVEYNGNHKKVKIICKKHGIFEQTPAKHILRGDGCPKCAIKKRIDNLKINENVFLKRSNEIHKNKYDYSSMEYKGLYGNKIKIICPEHGIFEQQSASHMNGRGCPKCANEKNKKNKLKNNIDFIKKSNIIHLNKYDYSLSEYICAHNKVKIICKKHGIFEQTANSHLNGNGCPSCRISKGEEKIKSFLDNNKIIYNKEYKFKDCKYKLPLRFDFYLPEYNMCIEYDGEQHFKKRRKYDSNENLKIRKLRDKIKNNYCKENNINILRIKYDRFKHIEHILNEKLKNNIKIYGFNPIIQISQDARDNFSFIPK